MDINLPDHEMVPCVIINENVSDIAKRGYKITTRGYDDLDYYTGLDLSFKAGAGVRYYYQLRHYDGHPNNTTTLYLPFKVSKDRDIIDAILYEHDITKDKISWIRGNGYTPR